MQNPVSGQRIQITPNGEWLVSVTGRQAERVAVCAVDANGSIIPFNSDGSGNWHVPAIPAQAEPIDIIAFITDDRNGGFVNDSYPITVEIAGEGHSFPPPDQQLAAVILAELYTKNGVRRAKVSNEGYTFGIDAYARAKQIDSASFPHRDRPISGRADPRRAYDDHPSPPRPHSQAGSASGSGVVISPNLVVTNAHVIEDGVSLYLGRTSRILTPVAVDLLHDLALLQGDVNGDPIPLRCGSPIWLGENVLAAGYPLMDVLGADLKVTTGNVSGLTATGGDVSRFQFTAPIASGSSGGAIVDEYGNLVGITSASLAHSNMRERGSISENVNFGIRCSLVFEMIAAAGLAHADIPQSRNNDRRDVVHRLRNSVVSILVQT